MRWAQNLAGFCLGAFFAWHITRPPQKTAPFFVKKRVSSGSQWGSVSGSEGDLEVPGVLERVLARHASYYETGFRNASCRRQKDVLFMLTDRHHTKWAHNLLLNLYALHIKHNVVIGSDAAVCDSLGRRLRAFGSPLPGCAHSSYLRNSSLAASLSRWHIHEEHVFHLWWQRWRYVCRSVALGFNVLFLDTDISLRVDPYPLLHAVYSHRQLVVGIESDQPARANRFIWPAANVGFLYVHCAHPNGAVHWLFSEVLRRFEAALSADKPTRHVKTRQIATNLLWEQDVFRDVLENMAFRLERSSARHARYHSGDSPEELNKLADSFDWQRETLHFFSSRQTPTGVWLPLHAPASEPILPGESVAGLPLWFFAAYGLEAHGNVLDGSWAQRPSPMLAGHFVYASKKHFIMRLLGFWHYAASAPVDAASEHTVTSERPGTFPADIKVLAFRDHGLIFTQSAHAGQIWRALLQLIMLAFTAGRRAVLPLVPCSAKRWLPRMLKALLSDLELVPLGDVSLCTSPATVSLEAGATRPSTEGWGAPPQDAVQPEALRLRWPPLRNWSFSGCCQPVPLRHKLLDESRRALQDELVFHERDLGQMILERRDGVHRSRTVRMSELLKGERGFTMAPLLAASGARIVVLDLGASLMSNHSRQALPSLAQLAAECARSPALRTPGSDEAGAPTPTYSYPTPGMSKFNHNALSFCSKVVRIAQRSSAIGNRV